MRRQVATGIVCVGLVSCGADRTPVTSVYDAATRELIRLDADTDRDGVIDARTYLRATTVLRTEVDTNGDGRVDRWEYVAGTLIARVGSSSLGDGVEDTWTLAASSGGEVIVDRALGGDRRPLRRETYRHDTLLRAEEDSNADGLTDKWEAFEGGRLRTVSFDTSGRAGRPDRRLVYDAAGQFAYLEVDDKRDGVFVRK
jgi:hypothetical protein